MNRRAMNQSAMNQATTGADAESLYITVRYLRGLFDLLRARGVALEPVLAAAHLTESELQQGDRHIPHALQDGIFAAAEKQTGDVRVGMHAGESTHVMHFGIVGQLALSCATGGDLLHLQTRYQRLIGNCVRSELYLGEQEARLDFTLLRQVSPHAIEYTLAAQITLARLLAGPTFVPTRIDFPYPPRPLPEETTRVWGPAVRFDQPRMVVAFPRAVMTLPLVVSDPSLRPALEAEAIKRLESIRLPRVGGAEVEQCRRYVAARLSGGPPTIEDAASAMGVSVRTLQRTLSAANVTYRDLTEQVRRGSAELLLRREDLSLVDIAFLLGFSEQAAFHRAFKRWFRMTPSEMRSRDARG